MTLKPFGEEGNAALIDLMRTFEISDTQTHPNVRSVDSTPKVERPFTGPRRLKRFFLS